MGVKKKKKSGRCSTKSWNLSDLLTDKHFLIELLLLGTVWKEGNHCNSLQSALEKSDAEEVCLGETC